MIGAWNRLAERLDSMSLRERVLIFAAGTALLVLIAKAALIDPELAKQRTFSRAIGEQRLAITTAQQQIRKLVSEHRGDPNEALRGRIATLKIEVAGLEREIAGEERRFTGPDTMRETLAAMLTGHAGLRLLDLKTIAAVPVATATGPTPRKVYRHGVELTLEGAYLDIHAYLLGLESLKSQLHWGRAELSAAYPVAKLKLTVFTMSVDPAWMEV